LSLPFAAVAWVAQVRAAGTPEPLQSLIGQGLALVGAAYQRAPVLVLVLSALLILPAVALASFAVHARTRRRSREAALRAAARRARAGTLLKEEADAGMPAWAQQAWLTVEGRPGGTMPLAGEVIRIGRHEENDIRLADRSVHRYHAVIERTRDEAFVIIDVSGKDGNGVRVNGERTRRARLADGDVIELGRAKLRFEHAPV
jgi:hypothetical protein